MQEAYLRGYYGYKNFGDELLLFGIIPYLFKNYNLQKLIIEVGDEQRIQEWLQKNKSLKSSEHDVEIVPIKQHKRKRITHIAHILGLGKHKKLFKFFGGGEVLSDERAFWHDGRSIPVIFNSTIRKGNFALLGGMGSPKKAISGRLYKYLLPKAKEIISREKTSKDIAQNYTNNIKLHEDFALDVLRRLCPPLQKEGWCEAQEDFSSSQQSDKYILINANTATCTNDKLEKIQRFCKQYPEHKRIFFSCDMTDDIHCFETVKSFVPGLDLYDRTKHPLEKTIELFSRSEAGIGSRLHFLLPLKFFDKTFESISKAEKIQKMMNS